VNHLLSASVGKSTMQGFSVGVSPDVCTALIVGLGNRPYRQIFRQKTRTAQAKLRRPHLYINIIS